MGDAQVARVDEADKLGPLVIEQRVGAHGVGGGSPGIGKRRLHVCLVLVFAGRIAAVAVDAGHVKRLGFSRREVRIVAILVALDAAVTIGVGSFFCLMQRVAAAQGSGFGKRIRYSGIALRLGIENRLALQLLQKKRLAQKD